jgi:hypothetical protein
MAMVGEIDGLKTLIIGDQASVRGTINLNGAEASGPRQTNMTVYAGEPDLMSVAIVYYNHLRAGDLPDGGRLLEEIGAELVCSGPCSSGASKSRLAPPPCPSASASRSAARLGCGPAEPSATVWWREACPTPTSASC